jgi:hypothetical protein
MLAQLRASKEAELAAARAHAQRVQAGRAAAQSPRHLSRKKQQKPPPRGRAANPATSKRAEQPPRRAPTGAGAITQLSARDRPGPPEPPQGAVARPTIDGVKS